MNRFHDRHMLAVACTGIMTLTAAAEMPTEPKNTGPVKMVRASWLGGRHDDEIVAVALAPDNSIVLAGNTADLRFDGVKATRLGPVGTPHPDAAPPSEPPKRGAPKWQHPDRHGFIVRLSADGSRVLSHSHFGHGIATIRTLHLDPKGNPLVLADVQQPMDLAGEKLEKQAVVVGLAADGTAARVLRTDSEGVRDFALDGNGDVVILTKSKLTRHAADSPAVKWTATWKAHGDNRSIALAVDPATGVAAVTGYGMTHTGKEPYKDPYAYGFDRDGKPLWSLWNPDPTLERDVKFKTPDLAANGLMADTTGRAAGFGPDGKLRLALYADGGNSVCTRDPADPGKPLDNSVFANVFQKSPGHGFKGAARTSVIFSVDGRTGKLEKGTWMCAWKDPAHANSLGIDAMAGDAQGRNFVTGSSAFGCPTKDPWYVCKEGGYAGGGYLAVMDEGFKMIQCGYFPGSSMAGVAVRGDTVVVAGKAKHYEDEATKLETRTFQPLQKQFGGGDNDGYFVVLKLGK